MLDTDTKRRIDTARDILVGKVPDPKSQVEQITIALIYKFMDDLDAESEELGGKRSFFAGDFAQYGWARLMRSGLGGHEMLALYAEAIVRMPENPGIPPLFRTIFNNAYLPYRDPETLRAFLKIIDEFAYDHSERLGDAYEYLLSVLGSQGDAGQFRTPRHIIDFIVAVVDPKKDETVLDPACGTAGFLISAYKHILAANMDEDGNSTLTPDEMGRLAANFKGYDISPDMVRLSLVNMYLHHFVNPQIVEYDTLTSDELWNEYADVILANPPFMSPKGGIRPHNRFSVQSKRSEVLFVDYMAEHLTATGRAGIIVPEGIIFQSQNAYKQLRKLLVEEYLVAVVSLPAGVFNPYSGVKTSILFLDRTLAKKADHIAFFKVENDGFDLGAQRRPIENNDLPLVQDEVFEYLRSLRSAESLDGFQALTEIVARKDLIGADGIYSLSGERYKERQPLTAKYPLVEIGEVCNVINGSTPLRSEKRYWNEKHIPWFTVNDIRKNGRRIKSTQQYVSHAALQETSLRLLPSNTVLICCTASVGEYAFAEIPLATNQQFNGLVIKSHFAKQLDPEFLFVLSSQFKKELIQLSGKTSFDFVSGRLLKGIEIPLPPLEVQQEIVAEIEGYQKVIDGARAVIENYRPHIPIDPDWPMVELGNVARLVNGRAYKRNELLQSGPTPVLRVGNFFSNRDWYYSDLQLEEDKYCDAGDLLYAWSASFGPRIWGGPRAIFHYHIWKIETTESMEKDFLYFLLETESERIKAEGHGIAMMHATKSGMERREFPLPPLSTQQAIVTEIKAEQALVAANHELVQRMEEKIRQTIESVWDQRA